MQHVHGVRAPGHVDHAIGAAVVRDANLFDTLANGGQRFEIVRLRPSLYLVQLIAGIVSRRLGEFSQALERVAEESHWPHMLDYIRLDIARRRLWCSRLCSRSSALRIIV